MKPRILGKRSLIKQGSLCFIVLISFLILCPALGNTTEGTKAGVKARVAVARFGATDRFAQVYGGWDIGGGLAAQVVTELINSGKVIVVERAILSQILREHELRESDLVRKDTAAEVGQLLGVNYLVVGEVTEFEQKAVGAGGRFGILKWIFPKISSEFAAAHVAVDLRIIDTTTGEIIRSHRAEGRAWEKSVAVDLNFPNLTFGGDTFHKTPLGKATRKVIRDALQFLLAAIDNQIQPLAADWMGKIIHQDATQVYINAGSDANVAVGDRLSAFSIETALIDPETNQTIGLIEKPIAELVVIAVAQKYSKARPLGTVLPSYGDIVRFSANSKKQQSQYKEVPLGTEDEQWTRSKMGYPVLD